MTSQLQEYRTNTLLKLTFLEQCGHPAINADKPFKGWLQTWLVVMRRPSMLIREMGLGASIVFQVLIGGLILSSLAHPLVIAYIAVITGQLLSGQAYTVGPMQLTLFVMDMANIFGSYAIFIALGRAGMTPPERAAVGRKWMLTPVYWLLASRAAWRAVRELRSNPFFWNKTAHRPARTGAKTVVTNQMVPEAEQGL